MTALVKLRLGLTCVAVIMLVVRDGDGRAAVAADKPKSNPPGVLVEPPKPRRNTDKNQQPTPERPGCPADGRKLELMV
jgi:hypothetical protein